MKHLKLLAVKVTGEAGSILELPNIFLDDGTGNESSCCSSSSDSCNGDGGNCCNDTTC